MESIHIRPALRAGWTAFTRRPWYLLGLTVATLLLFAASMSNALVTALAYILYGGYLTLLIRHYRGAHIEFDDLFAVTDFRWVSFAFLGLIKGFFILLGFICFIVPGVYLAVRWMYAELLVIDQGMRPLQALRASSKMTEGNRFKLFLFLLIVIFSVLIGLFLLIAGAFVAATVAMFALIKLYEDAKERLFESDTTVTAIDDETVTIG